MLTWKKIRAGIYHATSPWGLYTIDGNNFGRNRWTVTYPDNDYGMADTLGEAKAWAEMNAETRAKPHAAHATKSREAELIEEAAYAVFERPGGEDLSKEEFLEEVRGLLRGGGSSADRQINVLYRRIYGDRDLVTKWQPDGR
jgi:hypothetical protein